MKEAKAGKLIVVEGLEGAGKTTAIHFINEFLVKNQQIDIVLTREPGGTALGESIRSILKDVNTHEPIDSLSELLLIYAARVQHLNEKINPALNAGKWVICDRFELSTYAYQGGGRGIPLEIIAQVSQVCLNNFQPDLTLFLDIEPEIGLKRVQSRGRFDRFEQEPLSFFKSINRVYQQIIPTMNNLQVINANQTPASVRGDLTRCLQQFVNQ